MNSFEITPKKLKIIYKSLFRSNLKIYGNKKIILKKFSEFPKQNRNAIKFLENVSGKENLLKTNFDNLIIAKKKINVDLKKNCLFIFKNPRYLYSLFIKKLINLSTYDVIFESRDINDEYYFKNHNIKTGINVAISVNTILLKNTFVDHGTVIGKNGLAIEYFGKKKYFFPHIGRVKIGKNCYIGSNCVIMRGMIENTIIGNNCSIGNLVNIGHNVQIGNNVTISSGALIAGGTKIGDNTTISLGAKINEKIKIGKNCFIGVGAVVTKSFNSNSKLFGNPAYKYGSKKI